MDLLYLGGAIALFALSAALVAGCEALRRSR
ncbi:MAG TPA: potassium ABC transporter ATPase [Burkholderiales bacterium]|nr:potassium ABC transporter ATPase [Burkholderiales bacterium]